MQSNVVLLSLMPPNKVVVLNKQSQFVSQFAQAFFPPVLLQPVTQKNLLSIW